MSVTGTAAGSAVTAVTGTGRAMEADIHHTENLQKKYKCGCCGCCGWKMLENVGRCWNMLEDDLNFHHFFILTSLGFQVCEIGGLWLHSKWHLIR